MLTVINYHYIRENFEAKFPSIFGVTPNNFKKQLLLLKNENDFVSPNNILSNYQEIVNSKENYFFITFDDGLKEQFQLALPILNELQLSAVFFANSRNFEDKKLSTVHKIHLLRTIISPQDFLKNLSKRTNVNLSDAEKIKAKNSYIYDGNESATLKYLLNFKMDFTLQEEIIKCIFDQFFDEDKIQNELYMNEKELIQLSQLSFLGSHTHNHYPIGLLKKKEIQFELENSKLYFEKLTNSEVNMVAYPYGTPESSTNEVAQMAKKIGYKFGFTTSRGINSSENNKLLLNRFDCNDLPGGKNYIKYDD